MLAAALVLLQSVGAQAGDKDRRYWNFIIGPTIVTNDARLSQEACFRVISKVEADGYCFNNDTGEAFNRDEAKAHLAAVSDLEEYPILRTK